MCCQSVQDNVRAWDVDKTRGCDEDGVWQDLRSKTQEPGFPRGDQVDLETRVWGQDNAINILKKVEGQCDAIQH